MSQDRLPQFHQENLRRQSLTHSSYANECPEAEADNERLEFLGDAVLGFLIGEFLYHRYPQMSEAHLTRLRSCLVDEPQLARLAVELNIGDVLRLGKGAIKNGAAQNPAILSDTLEALIGAYFLDAGMEATREFVLSLLAPVADSLASASEMEAANHLVDVKNRFQEWALAKFGQNPEYFSISESGPPHAKEFIMGVRVNGRVYGIGRGRTKKEATKAAAREALS